MNETEAKGPKSLYTAGDAILYCIGDRVFPGIVISSRYKSGLIFLKSGWEYIILCGGLTYRVQEDDLWPHQYQNEMICPFAAVKKESSFVSSSAVSEDRSEALNTPERDGR